MIFQRLGENMKIGILRMLVAAAVAIIVSTAANAAEYLYLNAVTNKRWTGDLLIWLQKNKPSPENISIAITPAGDVHAYIVPGSFAGTYSVDRLLRHPANHPNTLIRAIIDGGTGRLIGFAPSEPPQHAGQDSGAPGGAPERFDVYILTWTKPSS